MEKGSFEFLVEAAYQSIANVSSLMVDENENCGMGFMCADPSTPTLPPTLLHKSRTTKPPQHT